jgi:hypothetical protein
VGAAVGDFQLRIAVGRQGCHPRARVGVVDKGLHAVVALLGREAFQVVITAVGIVVCDAVNPVGFVLLHPDGIFREVVAGIVSGGIILSFGGEDDDFVIALEFAQQASAAVGVEPHHVLVEPDVLSGEGGGAALLHLYFVDGVAREEVALRAAPLDGELAEVEVHDGLLQPRPLFEHDFEHFGLSVGVHAHVEDAAAGRAFGDGVFAVARDAFDGAALHHDGALLSVAVEDVVNRPFVVALEDADVLDAGRIEGLVAHLRHHIVARAGEDDDFVDVGTVADVFVLLHGVADAEESTFAVDVEFGVGDDHFRRLDAVESPDFGAAFAVPAVSLPYPFVPCHGIVGQMFEVVADCLHLLLDAFYLVVGLRRIVFRNADEAQFGQLHHILARHLAPQQLFEGFEACVHGIVSLLARFAAFDGLIDFVLDEDAFERGHVPLLVEFAEADAQFRAEQVFGAFGTPAQDFADADEVRLLVGYDARVGRYGDFAVGEGVQGVDGLVGRFVGAHVDDDFHLFGGVVVHFPYLDFSLFVGLDDGLLDGLGCGAVGDFGNGERALVDFGDACAHLHYAAAQSVVVARHVDEAARLEVGIERERFAPQTGYGGVDEFVEVVRQDFRGEAHRDTLYPLRQQQRELHGQRDGFLVAAVIGEHPLRGLGIKHHVEGELAEPGLDVTRRGGHVAREDVAPVALRVDEQLLLAELHEGVADGGVAVGVVLHRLADDVRHLVVASIVDFAHSMQNAPVYRFEAVLHMGYGPFQYHVRRIVQKPVLVHARQTVAGRTRFREAHVFFGHPASALRHGVRHSVVAGIRSVGLFSETCGVALFVRIVRTACRRRSFLFRVRCRPFLVPSLFAHRILVGLRQPDRRRLSLCFRGRRRDVIASGRCPGSPSCWDSPCRRARSRPGGNPPSPLLSRPAALFRSSGVPYPPFPLHIRWGSRLCTSCPVLFRS